MQADLLALTLKKPARSEQNFFKSLFLLMLWMGVLIIILNRLLIFNVLSQDLTSILYLSWLKQAGFPINTPIDVHVMHECIVITVDHERPMPKPEISNDMEYRYLFIDGLPVKDQAPILTQLDQWIEQYQTNRS